MATIAASGCAHAAEEVAKKSTETAVQKTAQELAAPGNRKALAQFWADPELQTAARQLAASATDGTLDALTDDQRVQRLTQVSSAYLDVLAGSLADSLTRRMGPRLTALTANAVDVGMQRALSPRNQAAIRDLVADASRASVSAMAEAVRDDMGPAIRHTLAADVGPGLMAMLDPNLNHALAGTTQQIAYASVVGAQNGLTGAADGSWQDRADQWGSRAVLLMRLCVVALGLGVAAFALFIVWLRVQARRDEMRLRRREAGTLFLAQALASSEDKPWSGELRELVRETLADLSGKTQASHKT